MPMFGMERLITPQLLDIVSRFAGPESAAQNQGLDVTDLRTPASDAYMQMLQQFPQRQQPSTYRNILGALGGLGASDVPHALQAQDLIRFRPFYNQLQDWEAKLEPLKGAMQAERY